MMDRMREEVGVDEDLVGRFESRVVVEEHVRGHSWAVSGFRVSHSETLAVVTSTIYRDRQ